MTLNNFEKELKDKLDQREIQPSKRAWEEISSSLEGTDQPAKTGYFWYGVAAGFIGLLLITVIYFNADEAVIPGDNQITEAPEKTSGEEQITVTEKKEFKAPVQASETTAIAAEESGFVNHSREPLPEAKIAVAVIENTPSEGVNSKVIPAPTELIIDTKLEEIIAQVEILEKDNKTLTDAEVDSLLLKAQDEILTDRLFREDRSVDATALLNEVEEELDQSFRDQIFEKLKTGFIKVRTAVADRNN